MCVCIVEFIICTQRCPHFRLNTNGEEKGVLISEVEMHARVVLGVGKGVLFREVFSVQECPHRERGSTVVYILYLCVCVCVFVYSRCIHE